MIYIKTKCCLFNRSVYIYIYIYILQREWLTVHGILALVYMEQKILWSKLPCHFFRKRGGFRIFQDLTLLSFSWTNRSHIFRFSNYPELTLLPFLWTDGSRYKSVGMFGLSWRENGEDWKFSFLGKNDEGAVIKFSKIWIYFPFHEQTGVIISLRGCWVYHGEKLEIFEHFLFLAKKCANPSPFFRNRAGFQIFPKFDTTPLFMNK